jgi:hypothetical protein
MDDQLDDTIDDVGLTRPKKQRSEAQKAATERMRKALEIKTTAKNGLSKDEKKLRLQAIKEQLNGPLKKNMDKTPTPIKAPEPEPEPETESEEEVAPPPPAPAPKKKEKKILSQPAPPVKPKKEPKVIYESASESEEEVIVVKKKKKPKKKTIIYEDATESEDEEPVKPVRKERETKTQQNLASKFKVTPGIAEKPKGPLYYFAD